MRWLGKFLLYLVLLTAVLAAGMAAWLHATRVEASDLPPLQSGDIVFQESGNAQSAAISLASMSLYTHTGIVEIGSDGRARVVEAAGPVRTTALEDWMARGTAGRITVKRMKGLDAAAAGKVLEAAHALDGRPYDFYFFNGRDAIYCSELVHLAFKDGAGIEAGKPETIQSLNIDNSAVRSLIESRWRDYPLCRDGKAVDFDTCYQRILQQTLVTPASVARDPKLETVFTNFGLAAE